MRIVLVDDHEVVRHALRVRLTCEADCQVVGEAHDGVEALAVITKLRPDVALMDIELPHLDGIAVTRQLRDVVPECAVIVVSVHDDPVTRSRAAAAGAAAFLGKHEAATGLLPATLRAVTGHTPP